MLDRVEGGDFISQAIRNAVLSWPYSYLYMPYATRTASQVVDAWGGVAWYHMWNFSASNPNVPHMVRVGAADIAARGGPQAWFALDWWENLGAADTIKCTDWRGIDQYKDDDGSRLPTSYQRIREGIERFFITDINNPAASAQAQSTIPVMWDAWGTNNTVWETTGAVARFNHLPGGSNVLWMDGHVEFVKFQAKSPILNITSPPNGDWSILATGLGFWSTFVGGIG